MPKENTLALLNKINSNEFSKPKVNNIQTLITNNNLPLHSYRLLPQRNNQYPIGQEKQNKLLAKKVIYSMDALQKKPLANLVLIRNFLLN